MNTTVEFESKTKALIDSLKSVCANYGLGNDGNEFKIITQVFLYKFMNDKFIFEIKKVEPSLNEIDNVEDVLEDMSEEDLEGLLMLLDTDTAVVKPSQFISTLFKRQNEPNFATIFDETLLGIASQNSELFSVVTNTGEKVVLFENLSKYVSDKRDEFCLAIVNKLVGFSFEKIFNEKFDFFATIFEYLIKDYNTNSGGKYAEYFTPHAVSKIMARCLVSEAVDNVSIYDPSAGSGTLLMNLAHVIGEDNCSVYSQDISQKSSNLLRLNLILNGLVHSIPNIVKGNTISEPFHREQGELTKFDYIVSNPPFKLDFSDYRDDLDTRANSDRFFAGIPKVPNKKKDSMAIYLLFIQHIMHSLSTKGKAAIVVPTGFITAQSGVDKKIRQKLVQEKMLAGVVSMPSNIFATTGTNVSVLFLDKQNNEDVILIDASGLGETIKEGKNQRTVLTFEEEEKIIETFSKKEAVEDFSVIVSYDDLEAKNYSLSAGQYFEVKVDYVEISQDDFRIKLSNYENNLGQLFKDSSELQSSLLEIIKKFDYGN
jgi:type I restriction enzyme M protein